MVNGRIACRTPRCVRREEAGTAEEFEADSLRDGCAVVKMQRGLVNRVVIVGTVELPERHDFSFVRQGAGTVARSLS